MQLNVGGLKYHQARSGATQNQLKFTSLSAGWIHITNSSNSDGLLTGVKGMATAR